MSFRVIHILFIFSIILVGCVAPPPKPVDTSLDASNSSVLTIRRAAKYIYAGVGYRIFINGDYIDELWGGGEISRPIRPGKALIELKPYEFGIPSIGAKELSLNIELGYEYHVDMGVDLNGIVPLGTLVMVDTSLNIQVTKMKIYP